jgi:hypothetical protein
MVRSFLPSVVALALCASVALAQDPPQGDFAVHCGELLRGDGSEPLRNAWLVVRGGKVAAIQNDAMDNDLARKMLQKVFVDTILLGWSNLPKSDLTGNEADTELLDFTPENALALFAEMPDLYDDWESRAQKAAAFREAEREVSAGN